MISESEVSQIIAFFLAFAGLMVVVRLWHSYHTDLVRAELFALRDEMFLYAVDNKLLDSDAYTRLRNLMNVLIRYAHRLTAARLALMSGASLLFPSPTPPSDLIEWRPCADRLPRQQRAALYEFHRREGLIIASHIANRSLILKMVLHAFSAYLSVRNLAKKGGASTEAALNVVADHVPLRRLESEASRI